MVVSEQDLLLRQPGVLAPAGDRPAIPLGPEQLDAYTRRQLLKEERAIAMKYHGGAMWTYVVATVVCFAIWVSFFPLAIMGKLNLPLACLASCAFTAFGYIPAHEAMHSNIARKGSKWRWANELTGWLGTFPMIFPLSMSRLMHLEHHYHCNDTDKDPDYTDEAPNAVMAWYKTWYNRQPGVKGSIHYYKLILARMNSDESRAALKHTAIFQVVAMAFFFAMAWSGYAIEVALLWWLPRHVGLSWVRFFLSWAPHHPREGQTGRYENTYVFKSKVGYYLSMAMEYHLIHHLYPGIPNHRTRECYHELKPILEKRGVDCSAR